VDLNSICDKPGRVGLRYNNSGMNWLDLFVGSVDAQRGGDAGGRGCWRCWRDGGVESGSQRWWRARRRGGGGDDDLQLRPENEEFR